MANIKDPGSPQKSSTIRNLFRQNEEAYQKHQEELRAEKEKEEKESQQAESRQQPEINKQQPEQSKEPHDKSEQPKAEKTKDTLEQFEQPKVEKPKDTPEQSEKPKAEESKDTPEQSEQPKAEKPKDTPEQSEQPKDISETPDSTTRKEEEVDELTEEWEEVVESEEPPAPKKKFSPLAKLKASLNKLKQESQPEWEETEEDTEPKPEREEIPKAADQESEKEESPKAAEPEKAQELTDNLTDEWEEVVEEEDAGTIGKKKSPFGRIKAGWNKLKQIAKFDPENLEKTFDPDQTEESSESEILLVEEEKPAADTPKESSEEEEKPAADMPKESSEEEEKPAADTPKESPKEEEKPAADTPKEFPKEEEKPAADTPKEFPKEEEKPVADTPKESPKEEEKPAADIPKESPQEEFKEAERTPEPEPDTTEAEDDEEYDEEEVIEWHIVEEKKPVTRKNPHVEKLKAGWSKLLNSLKQQPEENIYEDEIEEIMSTKDEDAAAADLTSMKQSYKTYQPNRKRYVDNEPVRKDEIRLPDKSKLVIRGSTITRDQDFLEIEKTDEEALAAKATQEHTAAQKTEGSQEEPDITIAAAKTPEEPKEEPDITIAVAKTPEEPKEEPDITIAEAKKTGDTKEFPKITIAEAKKSEDTKEFPKITETAVKKAEESEEDVKEETLPEELMEELSSEYDLSNVIYTAAKPKPVPEPESEPEQEPEPEAKEPEIPDDTAEEEGVEDITPKRRKQERSMYEVPVFDIFAAYDKETAAKREPQEKGDGMPAREKGKAMSETAAVEERRTKPETVTAGQITGKSIGTVPQAIRRPEPSSRTISERNKEPVAISDRRVPPAGRSNPKPPAPRRHNAVFIYDPDAGRKPKATQTPETALPSAEAETSAVPIQSVSSVPSAVPVKTETMPAAGEEMTGVDPLVGRAIPVMGSDSIESGSTAEQLGESDRGGETYPTAMPVSESEEEPAYEPVMIPEEGHNPYPDDPSVVAVTGEQMPGESMTSERADDLPGGDGIRILPWTSPNSVMLEEPAESELPETTDRDLTEGHFPHLTYHYYQTAPFIIMAGKFTKTLRVEYEAVRRFRQQQDSRTETSVPGKRTAGPRSETRVEKSEKNDRNDKSGRNEKTPRKAPAPSGGTGNKILRKLSLIADDPVPAPTEAPESSGVKPSEKPSGVKSSEKPSSVKPSEKPTEKTAVGKTENKLTELRTEETKPIISGKPESGIMEIKPSDQKANSGGTEKETESKTSMKSPVKPLKSLSEATPMVKRTKRPNPKAEPQITALPERKQKPKGIPSDKPLMQEMSLTATPEEPEKPEKMPLQVMKSERQKAAKKKKDRKKFSFRDLFSGEEEYDADDERKKPVEPKAPIDDYNDEKDAEAIKTEINSNFHTVFARTAILTGTTCASIILSLLSQMTNLFSSTMRNGWLWFAIFSFLLFAVSVIASRMTIMNGLYSLRKFKGNSDTAAAIAAVGVAIQTITAMFTPDVFVNGGLYLYVPLVLLALLMNSFGKLMIILRTHNNFVYLTKPLPKYAGKIFTDINNAEKMVSELPSKRTIIGFTRRSKFMSNFLQLSYAPDPSEELAGKVAPFTTILSLLCGIIYGVISQSFAGGVTSFALTACMSVPVICLLAINIPVRRLCKESLKSGAMVTSYETVKQFCDTNAIMIDSSQLYPRGSVTLSGMKAFKQTKLNDAILAGAAIMYAVNGTMIHVFENIVQCSKDMLPKVENVIYEDGKGLVGWVRGQRVLIGNRELLEAHNITPPDRSVEDRYTAVGNDITYISVSGDLIAMFILSYKTDRKIAKELKGLEQNGVSFIIRTVDANITREKVAERFGLFHRCITILPTGLGNVLREAVFTTDERSRAYLVTRGKLSSFAKAVTGCIRIKTNATISKILQYLGIILGLAIVTLISFASGFEKLGCLEMLIYTGFWTVTTILVTTIKK